MLKFNKNLAAIHSYLSADEYVIKNPKTQKNKYYYIGLRNTCDILLEDFEKRFLEYFGVNPRRCKDGRTVVQNKEIYYKLTQDFSYYSREWQLPELPKKQLKYWLRAFFDCEGWVVSRKAQDRHIGLDSINHIGLKNIQKSLQRFNIQSKLRICENRETLRLLIYGKENLTRFQKEINFLHSEKRKKLMEAINSYVEYDWKFPKRNIKRFIKNIMKSKINGSNRIRISSIRRENLDKLSEYLMDLFDIESKVYGPIKNNTTKYYELVIQKKEEVKKIKRLIHDNNFKNK